jgi:hypothetical protein
MKALKLTIKKQWFDMIRSGEKPEEYRGIVPYWAKRFLIDVSYHNSITHPTVQQICDYIKEGSDLIAYDVQIDDTIHLYNGWAFSDKYPNFKIQCTGIEVREGRPEWGAEPGKKYFVIKLGEKL